MYPSHLLCPHLIEARALVRAAADEMVYGEPKTFLNWRYLTDALARIEEEIDRRIVAGVYYAENLT